MRRNLLAITGLVLGLSATGIFTHTTTDILDSLCVSKLGNTIRERCP